MDSEVRQSVAAELSMQGMDGEVCVSEDLCQPQMDGQPP